MEEKLLLIAVIVIGLDVVTNVFLMAYYPKWEKVKKKEIDEIKKQNRELKEFTSDLLNEVYE